MVFFVACKGKIRSDKKELTSFILAERNGLHAEEKVRDISVQLTYKPVEGSARINSEKYSFFILSYSKKNKELLRQLEPSEYSNMLQEFSFRMASNVSLYIDNSGPVFPLSSVFQQTYGMSAANNIILAFNKSDIERGNHLKFLVKEFGLGIGDVALNISSKNINRFEKE